MGVLDWETDHNDTAPVLLLEIYPLCYFTSSDGEEHGAATNVTGFAVVDELVVGFDRVFVFDKHVSALENLVEEFVFGPLFDHVLEVLVGREETEDTIGYSVTEGENQIGEVSGDSFVVSTDVLG